MDQWLPPSAELVVGLENEFPSAELAGARQYACARQYLQWAFLARKGAPLLKAAVDRILHPEIGLPAGDTKARKADLTTLELTGPGMWTQEIFKYVGGLVDEGQSLDTVLLSRVSMGLFPKNFQGIDTDHPGGLLLHNFEGSWKKKSWYLTRYLKRRAYSDNPKTWSLEQKKLQQKKVGRLQAGRAPPELVLRLHKRRGGSEDPPGGRSGTGS